MPDTLPHPLPAGGALGSKDTLTVMDTVMPRTSWVQSFLKPLASSAAQLGQSLTRFADDRAHTGGWGHLPRLTNPPSSPGHQLPRGRPEGTRGLHLLSGTS